MFYRMFVTSDFEILDVLINDFWLVLKFHSYNFYYNSYI